MKVGLGLYRNYLTRENFRFARQAGATHIVAHLTDYFADARLPEAGTQEAAWGAARTQLWSEEELRALRRSVEQEGLVLAAIENFDPGFWYDVLLDGPTKKEQLANLKELIRRVGSAGIPVIGYYFSLAGVWGHQVGPWARGAAESVAFRGPDPIPETPIPNGQVWNMVYDRSVSSGEVAPVSEEEMWRRLSDFLTAVVPVAEEAGVALAAHPDDPPVPRLRGTARLLYHPDKLQRLLDIVPSPSNTLEFCQGTVAEMPDSDVYAAIDRFSKGNAISYVHFRNVHGTAPDYREVFVDEGDVDMHKAIAIYVRNGYEGVIIPDHTPQMSCAAPWHAGMAYALGYIRSTIRAVTQADELHNVTGGAR